MGQVAGIALVWFIIEMLVWYLIADNFNGGWYVFGWFILAMVIGLVLIKKGIAVLNPMAKQMQSAGMMNPSMRPNEDGLMKTAAMAVAGVLLVIPGLLSDLLALLVILPPVQKKIKEMAGKYVVNNQEKMMQMVAKQMGGNLGGMGGMGGQSPFGGMGGTGGKTPFDDKKPFGNMGNFSNMNSKHTTIDGTAKTIQKDVKKIKSANDDD